jgi:hypothetical protein
MSEMNTTKYDLNVYITHFMPPEKKIINVVKSFILLRINLNYLRSYLRLLKHGHRGNQPWKKDIMTNVREKDYKNRHAYLSDVLHELNLLKVNKVMINIISNSKEIEKKLSKSDKLNVNFYFFEKYSKMNHINNSPWILNDLESPWLLAWEHKKIMLNDIKRSNQNSLFLYIEDDILFTQKNLEYWLESRKDLEKTALIPSFVVVEYSSIRDEWLAVNYLGIKSSKISQLFTYNTQKNFYIQLESTYCAIYMLDLDLALEYSRSKAFAEKTSRNLIDWDIGARSSMGVQFVDVPDGLSSRYVVPAKKSIGYYDIFNGAILNHLPNLYCQVSEIEMKLIPVHQIVLDA